MRTTSLSLPGAGSRGYVRFLYSIWALVYDWTVAWDGAYRGNARSMIEAVVSEGDRVLDVGVGTGLLAEYGAPLAGEYRSPCARPPTGHCVGRRAGWPAPSRGGRA